ncbi:MAG TPA: hypothetical protein VFA35_05575 [Burkholderiaceae bacterium]|nr:hypothetical protein [Burkholderiaceae bacterium]
MQANLQVVDTLKTNTPAPIELTPEQLRQVGGGLGPAGTWSAESTTEGPAGTW